MRLYLLLSVALLLSGSLSCIAQRADSKHAAPQQAFYYPWLSLGINVGVQRNYAHVSDQIAIPGSGVTTLVPVSTVSFGLRLQREFASQWSWRAGIDISSFGFRLLTDYGGGAGIGGSFLQEQTQGSFSIQYYPLPYAARRMRPYIRLGLLANIMKGPVTEITIESRRRLNGLPTYYYLIDYESKPWIRPGVIIGLGFSRRIRSGVIFDLVFVAYRGFSKLTDINYRVEKETELGPPEELLSTKIINRGSFIGFEGSIYLPPFRYRKVQRELNKQ